jgi:uncharacterized protein
MEPAHRPPRPGAPPPGFIVPSEAGRAREALTHYKQAMERLKAGDWQGFGAQMDELRRALERATEPAAR